MVPIQWQITVRVSMIYLQQLKMKQLQTCDNRIGGVMVSVLISSAVDRKTKDYKIGIYCFSTKHTAVREKRKEWLARNQDNVSEWGDRSTHRLLFQ